MKAIFTTTIIAIISLYNTSAFSATRYWIGGAGNWTETFHWAASSNGTTDNVLPTSSDNVVFDQFSGTGVVTVNSTVTVTNLDFTATCSAINLNITSNTFTVSSNLTFAISSSSETLTVSGGTLTVAGTTAVNGGTLTASSGTINANGASGFAIGFTASPATVNFSGATINIGDDTNECLLMTGGTGTINISAGTINIKNNIGTSAGSNFNISGGTVNVGTGLAVSATTLQLAGNNNFSGGTIDIKSVPSSGSGIAMDIYSTTTATAGLIKVTATNANYLMYPRRVFNLEINSTGLSPTFNITSNIFGSLTLTNGTLNLNGRTVNVTSDCLFNAGTFQATTGTLNVNGTGACFAVNGATINAAGATINVGNGTDEILRVYSGTLNISSGTINVKNYVMIDANGSTFSGGTINTGTGGSVSYTAFYLFGTGSFSGSSIIDVKNVQAGGSGIAVDISSGSTFTAGLIKISATNDNYILWTRKAFNLEINSSGRTATLSSNMTIYGDLSITNGTFISTSSTTTFNGSIAQNILGTSATQITFYDVTLNNANGLTVAPSSGIETTVKNTLTLTSGKITLGNYILSIGATGTSGSISGGTSSNYIITNGTGVLKQYNIGTGQRTSAFYPIGINSSAYNPITLSVSGTSTVDNFGIRVAQDVLLNGNSGVAYTTDVVDKTWYISEGTAAGSSVTITPQWNLSDELSSFTRSASEVRHYTSSWTSEGGSGSSGSGPFTITSSAITSFSPFAIFDATVLPIVLLEFNAIKNNENVDLNWSTLSEVNNDFFTVVKTRDGINFEEIGKINSNGNSSSIKNYELIDRKPYQGISYYQLIQQDLDGAQTYSELKTVVFENTMTEDKIFPNPSNGDELNLYLNNTSKNEKYEITIQDELGRLIHRENRNSNDKNILKININNSLSSGIYSIIVDTLDDRKTFKVIVR